MKKELLKKYFNNSCTEEELGIVLKWFEESTVTTDVEAVLFRIWEEMSDEEGDFKTDFNLILDKIHHQINLRRSEKILEKADHNLIKFRRQYIIGILKNTAAILLLPLLCFGLIMSLKYQSAKYSMSSINQAYNEIFSSVDAITKVTLPDGSNVWLNHSSSLKYPVIFKGKSRTVELKGEGYFEVTHNQKVPFIVKAGEIQVMARGTTFNILAYPNEDRIETSLIEGSVELQKPEAGGTVKSLTKMKPADLVVFNKKTNEINTRIVTDNRYFSWREGKLIFKQESISEVVKRLGRWFNVDIQIKDHGLLNLTITATFIDETLPEVMELIAQVIPVKYSISQRQQVSPGTFSKRTVILQYRK